jgi:hypothetical protein
VFDKKKVTSSDVTEDKIDLSNGIKIRDNEPEQELELNMPGSAADGKSPLI